MGWPAYVLPGLPDPATAGTGDASVIFGDLRSAYRPVDRQAMTLQRLSERFADTGDIGILVRYRVGGDVVRPGALGVYTM
jgi:HK97 family phage major capsid protein